MKLRAWLRISVQLSLLWSTLDRFIVSKVQGVRLIPKPLALDDDCPLFPRVKEYVELSNITFGKFANGEYHASGKANFFKRSHRWSDMLINITTCPMTATSVKNAGCTVFGNWKFEKKVCDLLKARNTLWTKVYDSVSPTPTNCRPLGPYTFNKAGMDSRLLEALQPPKGKLWIVDFLIRDSHEVPVCCFKLKGVLNYE
ncbi:uncharacterized protein LOC117651957 [Thrips palmi]|uniref:Uncharacterized protein LOC117651957 n=1 Tax=Thrips palmi TaxID=161013 RepID=A0A6P9A3L0_THRPL|nr:uncharacterized protein LOC117651957 [Thrips palmi]